MSSDPQQTQGGAAGSMSTSTTATNNNNNNNSFRPSNDQNPYDNSMSMYPMKQQPMASPITGTVYSGPPAKYLNHTANNYMRPMVTGQKYMNYNGASMQQQQQQQQRRQNNSTGVENATNDLVNKRKVFVGGLSSDTKMDHLRDYFSNFGTVESATVKYDKSGRSKGFGFVLFEDPSVPEKVYAQEVHIIQGKRVDTKSAHRRDQALARKVFVGGLDTEMTDNELREYFSQFGKIAQVEAPIDKTKQKRRPFCFILFENEQSAEEVLKQPRHTIAGKPVDCKRANPKTMDNNQQNNQMMAQALAHYSMASLNQNPYQYAQQPRSQQQLQYQQVALAAQQQQQQHYPFYNSSSLGQQSNQQGQTRSQSNRQQLSNNNQPWSPISPAQWQGTNYPVDPRTYGSYPTASATGGNGTWQVAAAPHPSQGNSYGQARNQSTNSSNNQGTNSQTGQYSYANWPYNQSQGAMGPNQYNYPGDSSMAAGNTFAAYPAATGYDHFSSEVVAAAAAAAAAAAVGGAPTAPPPSQANYNR